MRPLQSFNKYSNGSDHEFRQTDVNSAKPLLWAAMILAAIVVVFIAMAKVVDYERSKNPLFAAVPPATTSPGTVDYAIITKKFYGGNPVEGADWVVRFPKDAFVCETTAPDNDKKNCRFDLFGDSKAEAGIQNRILYFSAIWPEMKFVDYKSISESERRNLPLVHVILRNDYFPAENWMYYFSIDKDPSFARQQSKIDGMETYGAVSDGRSFGTVRHVSFTGSVNDGIVYLLRDDSGLPIANLGCDHDCFGVTQVENRLVEFRFDQKLLDTAPKVIRGMRNFLQDATQTAETPEWISFTHLKLEE